MKTFIALAAYGASVFLGWKFYNGYWVVGPVFGAALLAVHFDQVIKKPSLQHGLWLAASTLIYALVYGIAEKGWKFQADWLDMLAGAATGGVVVGSILLPSIHAFLFGTDSKTVRSASLSLVLSWYVVIFLSWLDQALNFRPDIPYRLAAIALWQGIYLKRMKIH